MPVMAKAPEKFFVAGSNALRRRQYNDIYLGEIAAFGPKTLTADAPQAVAVHRARNAFLGNRKTQTWSSGCVLAIQHREVPVG